jgi:hypothetical protein
MHVGVGAGVRLTGGLTDVASGDDVRRVAEGVDVDAAWQPARQTAETTPSTTNTHLNAMPPPRSAAAYQDQRPQRR